MRPPRAAASAAARRSRPRVRPGCFWLPRRRCVAARRALRPSSSQPNKVRPPGVNPAAAPDSTAFGQLFNSPQRALGASTASLTLFKCSGAPTRDPAAGGVGALRRGLRDASLGAETPPPLKPAPRLSQLASRLGPRETAARRNEAAKSLQGQPEQHNSRRARPQAQEQSQTAPSC